MAFDLLPFPVAQNGGAQADMFAEPFNGPLRTIGLNKIDGDAEQDHHNDNSSVDLLPQQARGNAGNEENDYQGIHE